MTVRTRSSQLAGVGGALAIGFLLLAVGGVWAIFAQGWGLIFEVAYLLILLIVFAIAADRLFVR